MRRTLAWLGKEAREHAPRVRLLFQAVPLLVLLAATVFSSTLAAHDWESRLAAAAFVAGALVLHALVVSSGLFATDADPATATPAQRLPGALGVALGAKGALFVVSAAVAFALGVLATAGALWLLGQPERAFDVLHPWHGEQGELVVACSLQALAYGACLALASACVRHPGAAVAVGSVLWALPEGAFALAHGSHPHVFTAEPEQIAKASLLFLAATATGVAVAWLVGRRRVATLARTGFLALGVLGLFAGAAAASAVRSAERAEDLRAESEDWTIQDLSIGPDTRVAVATVRQRITPWLLGEPSDYTAAFGHQQVRVIDLERGTWRRVGNRGAFLMPTPHGLHTRIAHPGFQPFERVPYVDPTHTADSGLNDRWEVAWIDGRTGAEVGRQLDHYPGDEGQALLRAFLRDTTTVRDAEGRRVWLRDGFLERDGAGPLGVPAAAPAKRVYPVRTGPGVFLLGWVPGDQQSFERFTVVDVDTGATRERRNEAYSGSYVLSPTRLLRHIAFPRERRCYSVVDLTTDAVSPARNVPTSWPERGWPIGVSARDTVLGWESVDGVVRVFLWKPESGERVELSSPAPLVATYLRPIVGPDAEGRWVAQFGLADRHPLVVLDPAGGRAYAVAQHVSDTGQLWPVLIEPDGAVVLLEDQRRIVRCHADGRRDVLFPRASSARKE